MEGDREMRKCGRVHQRKMQDAKEDNCSDRQTLRMGATMYIVGQTGK